MLRCVADSRAVTIEPPCCRAAIRAGVITLNAWTPRLVRCGPAPAAVATVTAALADLRATDGELIVSPVAHTLWGADAESALLAWAQTVGYERVWLPGRVVALDAGQTELGAASVSCPTCGAGWHDEGVEFWRFVLGRGVFPARCLVCGGSLPQWSVSPHPHGDPDRPSSPARTSRPDTPS